MINRRFLTTQRFEILSDGLRIEKKGLLDSSEFEISFEHIHNKKRIQTVTSNNLLFLSFFCLIIGILFEIASNTEISLVTFVLAAIFLGSALLTRQKTVLIPTYNGEKIELFYNSRNKQDILNFSDQIVAASNAYLLNKYGKIDRALPVEGQIANLNFLRDRNIITQEEYEGMKDQLLGRDNKGPVGFNR